MTTASTTRPSHVPPEVIPPLRDAERMTRAEFERRYDAMPELKKAELIEGVVYMPSPVSDDHGTTHFDMGALMGMYRLFTPGVVGSDNGSVRLDPESMPQPDLFLRILETHGGRSRRTADRYIEGGLTRLVEVMQQGIASAEHTAFVQRLQQHAASTGRHTSAAAPLGLGG